MCTIVGWIVNHLDRILSFLAIVLSLVAIVIAAFAIVDVRKLFKALEKRDRDTGKKVQHAVLTELLTHTASFAAYSRATQFIDFYDDQPDRVTAIAILMSFRLEQILAPDATKEGLAHLLRSSREMIEKKAGEYGADVVSSGMGKWNALYDAAAAKAHKKL
jgi:hypothetical protein